MCMYPDNAIIPTSLTGWDLFTQPIRVHQVSCGKNTTIGYPDPVIPFGNNSVINPWLGGMYAVLLVALLIGIPSVSFLKKIKYKVLVSYVSLLAGLFIVTNIFATSPYGHLDNWLAWTVFIIDLLFFLGTLVMGGFLVVKKLYSFGSGIPKQH